MHHGANRLDDGDGGDVDDDCGDDDGGDVDGGGDCGDIKHIFLYTINLSKVLSR